MATTVTNPVEYQDASAGWAATVGTALGEKVLREGDTMTGR